MSSRTSLFTPRAPRTSHSDSTSKPSMLSNRAFVSPSLPVQARFGHSYARLIPASAEESQTVQRQSSSGDTSRPVIQRVIGSGKATDGTVIVQNNSTGAKYSIIGKGKLFGTYLLQSVDNEATQIEVRSRDSSYSVADESGEKEEVIPDSGLELAVGPVSKALYSWLLSKNIGSLTFTKYNGKTPDTNTTKRWKLTERISYAERSYDVILDVHFKADFPEGPGSMWVTGTGIKNGIEANNQPIVRAVYDQWLSSYNS